MVSAKKWHIQLYATLLFFGGLLYGCTAGLSTTYCTINELAYAIFSGVGGVLVCTTIGCLHGLSHFRTWARKLTIVLNLIFLLHLILGNFVCKGEGSLASVLMTLLFGSVPVSLVIWYFSRPPVKALFDEVNAQVSQ